MVLGCNGVRSEQVDDIIDRKACVFKAIENLSSHVGRLWNEEVRRRLRDV